MNQGVHSTKSYYIKISNGHLGGTKTKSYLTVYACSGKLIDKYHRCPHTMLWHIPLLFSKSVCLLSFHINQSLWNYTKEESANITKVKWILFRFSSLHYSPSKLYFHWPFLSYALQDKCNFFGLYLQFLFNGGIWGIR